MSRGAATFRQRDAEALIRAVKAAGEQVYRVEVGKDGRIIIITSRENAEPPAPANPWDEVFDEGDVAVRP